MFGSPLYAMADVGSTMDVARELADRSAPEGTCIVADRQSGGRGRSGRRWESPPGGLYASLILRPSRPSDEWPSLSLVAGLALAETVHQWCRLDAQIRWPNDILIEGKKVAGILTETSVVTSDKRQVTSDKNFVVLGVGINATAEASELPDTATSLAAWGVSCDSYRLAAAFLRRLEQRYEVWRTGGFASVRSAWLARSGLVGNMVSVALPSEELEGQVADVDERGRLVIRLDAGVQRACEVGDVRLLRLKHPAA